MRLKFVALIVLVAFLPSCMKTGIKEAIDETCVPEPQENVVPGVLYLKAKSELHDLRLGQYILEPAFQIGGRFEARQREFGLDRWYVARFDENTKASKACEEISTLIDVDLVETVPRAKSNVDHNDVHWDRQWNLCNSINPGCDVNVAKAWEITTGSPEVIVAITDDGVYYNHEDLQQNMWVNELEANGYPGLDDDGNGYVDDIHGANFMADGSRGMVTKLSFGDHATHIAGVIAAVNDNGIGVSGIAGGDGSPSTGARIMNLVTSDEGYDYVYIYKAFQYAADNGAVIMNCSWSYEKASETPVLTREAIRYFNTYAGFDENKVQVGPMAGGLCIFSAGNDMSQACYPAMDDNVLSVSAVGPDFEAAYYTNYGDWVDLAAPGGDYTKSGQIYSTLAYPSKDGNLRYGYMQGTSMAAPHVAGVAALVVSKYKKKGFTRDMLFDVLVNSANPVIYQHNSKRLGSGLVDAYAALTMFDKAPELVHNLAVTPGSGAINVSFRQEKDGYGRYPDSFRVFVSESDLTFLNPSKPGHAVQVFDVDGDADGELVSAMITGLGFETRYHVRVAAMNVLHKFSILSEEVSVVTSANHPPVVRAKGPTSLSLKNFESGTMIFEATDEDGHELRFSLSDGLDGAVVRWSGGLAYVSVNALDAEAGRTYNGSLSTSDGASEVRTDLSYTILPDHDPVVKTPIPNVLLSRIKDAAKIDLGDYFEDPDGDVLSFIATQDGAGEIVRLPFYVRGGLTIDAVGYGSTKVTVTATDSRGNSVSTDFVALVRDGRREVDLYPNPVSDYLYVRTATEQTADVTVYAASGAALISMKDCRIDPFNPLKIDMSALGAGEYYLNMKGASGTKSYPVVKR